MDNLHIVCGNQRKCWDIIAAKVNKNKSFTNIQCGTIVSLNPDSKELVWSDSQSHPSYIDSSVQSFHPSDKGSSQFNLAGSSGDIDKLQAEKNITADKILLGTLDAANPTLSHLLKNNPKFSDNAWEIIFSATNRNKSYTSLLPGCQVSINPQTLELSFDQNNSGTADPITIAAETPPTPQALPAEIVDDPSQKQFSEKLAESVKAYLGQPYHEIDCYGLVVKGLKDQGVQYSGSDGLLKRLERMAADHGLPRNAYQNGEGLIEIAGNKL